MMKPDKSGLLGLAILVGAGILTLTGCDQRSATNLSAESASGRERPQSSRRIRAPAVAGLFYPSNEADLSMTIDRLLAAAPTNSPGTIKALVCPHAGYVYSGPTAASAYRLIAGGNYETVIILAASHNALFHGVSVPATDAYETPLGQIDISPKAAQLATEEPFVFEPHCLVRRPPWVAQGLKTAPPPGEDTPETWEHSVEVQVPFLQRTLDKFEILPVVFGDADPQLVAQRLLRVLDDRTLVIASTDLSHYRPYDEARKLDQQTIQRICELDIPALESRGAEQAACGRLPVLTLLHLAKLKGWTPHLLDYRNSGDTAGDKRSVVGYAAIAFCTPTTSRITAPPTEGATYSAEERRWLLQLARETLCSVVTNGPFPSVGNEVVPVSVQQPKGAFVTLTKNGGLRGCVGNILPTGPLYWAVMQNARSAALCDPRFPPITVDEVGQVRIEISVLTPPEPLQFNSPDELLRRLQPHEDGVVLSLGGQGATFLPQVWEQVADKKTFLDRLAQKAGFEPGAWREEDVSISTYHVEAFAEPK